MTDTNPTLDALNARHGLPGQLRFVAGPSNLPLIEIDNPQARARMALHGAHVLSFWPRSADADLLFLSERALYQPGKAIRGGVPVCWPWFGPDPEALGRPNHGFARTRAWQVLATAACASGETEVTLGLDDTPDTQALWPHAFALRLTVRVGAALSLRLSTRNTGSTAFRLTQALHSYLAVADCTQARVQGLDGCAYLDNARSGQGALRQQTGDVVFDGEVDRIYTGVPAALSLHDAASGRCIALHSEGSQTAVVWNPAAEVAAALADLAPGAWRGFVCVETANAAQEVISLPPGGEHVLAVRISQRA